jgi:methionine synthase II (cobalamin-independent)
LAALTPPAGPTDAPADPAPDPLAARSAREFACLLRLLKVWAGDPSFERLSRRSGVPRSTLADALSTRSARLPRLEVVRKFVRACGLDDEGAGRWERAWRLVGERAALESRSQARFTAELSTTALSTAELATTALATTTLATTTLATTTAGIRLTPELLPVDIADFSGREEQVEWLTSLLVPGDRAVRLSPAVAVISGRGGVGKSTLALHVAHLMARAFPDGQLYADLHFAEADPALILGRFLQVLGVDGNALPTGLEQRAEWYRGLLAGRRMLVVLDNAGSAAQVRPLIPGAPTCAVLVTSRSSLADLAGVQRLELDVPDAEDSVRLLAGVAGARRVGAEPAQAREISRLCGNLPLALRIVGARLACRPHWSLATLAGRLAGERSRLDQLALGDLDVRGCLALSYRALEPAGARALRLLALLDTPSFGAWVAAPLLGLGLDEAQDLVDTLADARLIDVSGPGPDGQLRYRFHHLVRLFGRERTEAEDPVEARTAALARALGGWLALAELASRRLPDRERAPVSGTAARWVFPPRMAGLVWANPAAWFEAERLDLVAAVAQAGRLGLHEHAWELAAASADFFDLRGYHDEARRAHQLALSACAQAGNRLGEAVSLLGLSLVRSDGLVTADQCLAWAERSAALFREVGEARGEAKALELAAYLNCPRGHLDAVMRHTEAALSLARAVGYPEVEAYVWYDRALAWSVCGRYQEAEGSFRTAIMISRRHGTRLTEAAAQYGLGAQRRNRGDYGAATEPLRRALVLTENDAGHASLRALVLASLAHTYAALRLDEAAPTAERALEECRRLGIGYGQAIALIAVSSLRQAEGRFAEAAAACEQAHRIVLSLQVPFQQALTLQALGGLHHAAGRPEQAAAAWREARLRHAELGNSVAARELDALIAAEFGALSGTIRDHPEPLPRGRRIDLADSMSTGSRSLATSIFRAETPGSLLRPAYLREARVRRASGELTAAEFTRIEDRAVDEAISIQEEAGLEVVTDGEMRRSDFMAPFYEGVEGVEAAPGRALTWTHVVSGEKTTWHIPFRVTGKVRRVRSPAATAFAYARARAHTPVKQSLPSPLLANWAWDAAGLAGAYSHPFELLADAAALIREQARELADIGCGYIQIDAPDIAGLADPSRGEVHPASGIPVARLLTEGLELVNTIPEGISGVTFALHLCRGNIRSHYATSGGYGRISGQVFGRLTNFGVFLLEFDDERAGGFEPLADCPDDKTVVLGLISSKIGQLEEPAAIAARVARAAEFHPREHLALSTQCGFATELDGNQISEGEQRAKLALVGRIARELWP